MTPGTVLIAIRITTVRFYLELTLTVTLSWSPSM